MTRQSILNDYFIESKEAHYVPCETEIHFSFRARREGASEHNRSISYSACASDVSVGTLKASLDGTILSHATFVARATRVM